MVKTSKETVTLMSFFVAGSGQALKHHFMKAIYFFLLVYGCSAGAIANYLRGNFWTGLLFSVMSLLLWVANFLDAHETEEDINFSIDDKDEAFGGLDQ